MNADPDRILRTTGRLREAIRAARAGDYFLPSLDDVEIMLDAYEHAAKEQQHQTFNQT